MEHLRGVLTAPHYGNYTCQTSLFLYYIHRSSQSKFTDDSKFSTKPDAVGEIESQLTLKLN